MSAAENTPAAEGGEAIVQHACTRRRRWGAPELERLTAMVEQESLFYWDAPQTNELLRRFRELYPLEHCMPCSSGSASLHIAVAALQLPPGSEVIVPAITDMGSVIGILYQQLVPVFADVDPLTGNLDVSDAAGRITPQTKAIMPVHLAGNPCDMAAVMALAGEHGLAVIEDCAQAWGATWQGEKVGLQGDLACYSFNEFKHLSCGDGGIVGTNREDLGRGLSKWGDKHYDRVAGGRNPPTLSPNYRISEPQSAVAAGQLTRHDVIVARRQEMGRRLAAALAALPGLEVPAETPGGESSFWFLLPQVVPGAVRISRDEFARALQAEGVQGQGAYIPSPVPGYDVFQNHDFFAGRWPLREAGLTSMDYRKQHFPQAERLLARNLTVLLHEEMSDRYLEEVIAAFTKLLRYYAA
ncbi:DegT/DnrJ/EryC1/StrS family aminotransferase [Actomonas aquatica]|uniref:DegT/DnrJ/EryC1/StrS family aminotransferase n=1 Tax=Actomonas aquatica TaxID=2866162 RepID=A0ABZ1CD38_9BACT|nr:DegT/DnrJ/EryC1/StrS family aminotransferase [Opitutus sp. WL0086]WRQ89593.1 DegT/DnrJ/EryC1/StrS family aminotransferase [Opitutus sp. WL0086]